MRKAYRIALYSSVASAALALAAPASAQTVVNQSANNSAPVSNPLASTNTIDLGGGGLGVGASVSTSASGAAVSTSVTAINSQFTNPVGGFGTVTQGAINSGLITNNGAITGLGPDAADASSVSIGAHGSTAAFSIIAVGGIPFQAVANVGTISQGLDPQNPGSLVVGNAGQVSNTGEITGPALRLSGMGATASVTATGAQSSVALSVMGATGFSPTTFGNISQVLTNTADPNAVFGVRNTLSSGGVALNNISGAGAGVSVSATGAVASVSLSYINNTLWQPTQIGIINQNVLNNNASVSNVPADPSTPSTITVGAVSGDGASVRSGATGAVASVSYSTIGSDAGATGQAQTLTGVGQLVNNNNTASTGVTNFGFINGTGLTGAGSSAGVNALGAGASFSASSIGDVRSAPLATLDPNIGIFIFQQVTNTGAGTTNTGLISMPSGALANGASASISATGAQAAISVSAINTASFTTPVFGNTTQNVTNGGQTVAPVTNFYAGITTGNLSGHGSSVSATATGAAASIGASFINTTAWTGLPFIGSVIQTATNNGQVANNMLNPTGLSVGSISGTGASVHAGATGAAASIAVTSILSGPPLAGTFGFGAASITQAATNTGPVINTANIVSTGTLSGMASSASITATGAATSVSVASINDTVVLPPNPVTVPTINQTSINNVGAVTNVGSITLGGGNIGAGAAASIGAVGASASISFLAIK